MHALMSDSEMQQVDYIAEWLNADNVNKSDSNGNDSNNNNRPINVLVNAIK